MVEFFFLFDLAGRKVIEFVGQRTAHATAQLRFKLRPAAGHLFSTVLLDKFAKFGAIQIRWIELLDNIAVALLPMRNEIGKQTTDPGHTAFKKRKPHTCEPTGDSAEEQRLTHCVACFAEMPNVIVNKIGQ